MKRYRFWYFICCVYLVACTATPSAFEQFLQAQQSTSYSLLIAGGSIIDGTGAQRYNADLLVQGDTIAFIGQVDTTRISVDDIINAKDMIVSPGFIDTHAHGNPMQTPEFANFLSMGVTTIALGQDGSSPEHMAAWMQRVEDTIPGVNIAMFTGHGTLRMLSGIEYNPQPSSAQLQRMGDTLRAQLRLGCFGMSSGLEYVPGTYAPAYELEYLAKIVGEEQKLIASHIRNEDDSVVESSIQELLMLGSYCPVHISHLKVVYGQGEKRANEILRLIAEARAQGTQVTADVYPYTASYTGISIVFPEWALPPHDYEQVVKTKRKALATFLRRKIMQRNGPEATLLGTMPFAGKTLADMAREKRKPFEDVLIDDIKPGGASGAYFVMNDSLQARFIVDSLIMICSDGSPTSRHPRGHGTFAKIIEDFVVKDSLLNLEDAIRKMTSLSAKTIGIRDRGMLKTGAKADMLVFDPKQVHATAAYEDPFQLAQGFACVIVNGKVSLNDKRISENRHGRLLR